MHDFRDSVAGVLDMELNLNSAFEVLSARTVKKKKPEEKVRRKAQPRRNRLAPRTGDIQLDLTCRETPMRCLSWVQVKDRPM